MLPINLNQHFADNRNINHHQSRIKEGRKEKFCTFNLQGGLDPEVNPTGAATLFEDFRDHEVEIAALQEVHVKEDRYFGQQNEEDPAHNGIIYAIAGRNANKAKRYGQGFFISAKWRKHYISHEYISDRISAIHFNLNTKIENRDVKMTIINAYAPHTGYLVQSPEEIPAFYELLTETYTRYNTGNNALVIVMGDFNSKLGQKTRGETTNIVGSYGKGKRNRTGNLMAEFMEENNLLATNTIFRKSIFKRITWTKCLQGEIVYNQIDYILLEQQKRHLCEDSQAYRTFLYGSDHFPVITTFNLKELYRELPKGKKTGAIANLEYNKLTT